MLEVTEQNDQLPKPVDRNPLQRAKSAGGETCWEGKRSQDKGNLWVFHHREDKAGQGKRCLQLPLKAGPEPAGFTSPENNIEGSSYSKRNLGRTSKDVF